MRPVSVVAAVNLGSRLKAGYRGLAAWLSLQYWPHMEADATLNLFKPWAGSVGAEICWASGQEWRVGMGRIANETRASDVWLGENCKWGYNSLVQLPHNLHLG